MKDIDRAGIASVVEQALAIAGADTAGVHVSFDLDVCDPTIAPGVGTPVKGGLDYREAHMLMEMVADSGLLRALDLVEVNPILDDRNMTAVLGAELASSALGQKSVRGPQSNGRILFQPAGMSGLAACQRRVIGSADPVGPGLQRPNGGILTFPVAPG